MSIPLQGKLLRVLQEKMFEPVGGSQTIDVDVRILGATNKDLAAMMNEKSFRDDLYYRLNVVEINMPPLRERRGDVRLLCEHSIARLNRELGKNVKNFSDEIMGLLMEYDWPGNVRELENVIERAMVLGKSDVLGIDNFPAQIIRPHDQGDPRENFLKDLRLPEDGLPLIEAVEDIERKLITMALDRTGGNKTKAAKLLNVTRKIMRYKTEKYGLDSAKDENSD
jgi:two-component system response regulator AtoC